MSYRHMKAKHHIEDQNWELLAKSFYDENPEFSKENQSSVMEEVLPEEKEREQLHKMTKQVDLYFSLKKFSEGQAWEKVESRIHNQSSFKQTKIRKLISNPLYRIAAAILFAALLLVPGYKVFYKAPASMAMMKITSTGQVMKPFTLPDGTVVSLNSNSRLNYPKKFTGKIREVSIEGEAFFEVKPNKSKPFIIHAGKAQIQVLGTSFNVCAYPDKKRIEVIVETGKVQVLNKSSETIQNNELILIPGDKGTLVYSSNSLQKTTNQDPNFLAWKTRSLIFKATSLGEVIGDLEKVYKVNIRLADPKLNGLLLTAQFNDYSLDFIMKVIETTFQIEVNKDNGQYILTARS